MTLSQTAAPFSASKIAQSTFPYRGDPLTRERWVQRSLVYSYGAAFAQVEKELDALMGKWDEAVKAGKPVSPSWAMRQERYQSLMRQYHDAIFKYGMDALTLTSGGMRDAVAAAINYTPREVRTAAGTAPTGFLGAGFDSATWNTVNHAMLTNMTAFLTNQTSPLRKLFEELGTDTFNAVRQTMMQGLGTGIGPKKLASRIKNTTANIALGRARVIARTEYHRAYRYAKRDQFMASPVIKGWVWRAAMTGSCGVCLAMSGSVHSSSDVMESHPNCRCVMVPLTKSWDELGFPTGYGTPSSYGPGKLGIDSLDKWVREPGNMQKAIDAFGKKRFKLLVDDVLQTGNWSTSARKFVTQTTNPLWGGGRRLTPLQSRVPKVVQQAITTAKAAVSFALDPVVATLDKVRVDWLHAGAGKKLLYSPFKGGGTPVGGYQSYQDAKTAKSEVSTELGDRLVDAHFDQLVALENTGFFTVRTFGNYHTYNLPKTWDYMNEAERRAWLATPDGRQMAREIASQLVGAWAGTSGDSDPLSVLMQRAAQEELGLAGETSHLGGWGAVDTASPLFALAKSFVREMYDYTQAQFAAQGITEVLLARGIGYSPQNVPADWKNLDKGDSMTGTVTGQPLSSWAADPAIAEGFGLSGYQQYILSARIPVSWIVGSARTGYGCFEESEFVVASPREFQAEVLRRR